MSTNPKFDRWILAGIGGIAFAVAAAMLIDYARAPDDLWRDAMHDRNSHLASGMAYAGAWRALDLVEIVVHSARSVVWPPVHGILLGFILLPWMDYRLGPAASLIGWWMTVFVAALIARRMYRDPLVCTMAASLTAIFVIASPAFRLFGSDVMLEGLGAGLSALALLLYLRAMERPVDTIRWRWLGLALTCLFFEKYNYWAMLVATLAIAYVAEQPLAAVATLRRWLAAIAPWGVLRSALRDPLLIASLVVAVAVAVIYALKPSPIMVFGKPVGLYPPENLTTIAYVFLFARVAVLWRRNRTIFKGQVGPALRVLTYWHLAPILLSFLIPKRLSGFVWFLGPNNTPGRPGASPLQSAIFQWPGFAEGFHVATWSAVLVTLLAIVGGAKLCRMPGGARAVALFPLVSACALLSHPQQQWRFEATWLFGLWICAGVGGALLWTVVAARLQQRAQMVAAALVICAMAAAHLAQPVSGMAAAVAIRQISGPSDLEFARAYLPHLQGRGPVGFLTSFGRSDFFSWSVRNDCGCERRVDAPFNGRTADEARAITEMWIARTGAERLVVIDAPGVHEYPEIGATAAVRRDALDQMRVQTRFRHVVDVPVPAFNATVSIWRRD